MTTRIRARVGDVETEIEAPDEAKVAGLVEGLRDVLAPIVEAMHQRERATVAHLEELTDRARRGLADMEEQARRLRAVLDKMERRTNEVVERGC